MFFSKVVIEGARLVCKAWCKVCPVAVDSKDGGQQLKKPYRHLFLSMNAGQLRKPCQKIFKCFKNKQQHFKLNYRMDRKPVKRG